MNDPEKTKEQLVKELNALRRQVAQWEASGGQTIPAAAALGDSEAEYRLLVKNLPNVIFKDSPQAPLRRFCQGMVPKRGFVQNP